MFSIKMVQYLLLLVFIAGAVYAVNRGFSVEESRPVTGAAAPLFALTDLQGEELALANYKGKGVLLNFWASWCTPCVNELPLLNEAYKLAGIEMLAINVGEPSGTVQKFADRYELAFPVGLDSEMTVKQQYRVVGLPLTVLIDADGTIIERHEGELTEMADILTLMERIRNE